MDLKAEVELILAPGVVLVPEAELTPSIRARLQLEPGDHVISRPQTRQMSQVVDRQAVDLLREFDAGKTIARALEDYCRDRRLDPAIVREEALYFLNRMQATGVLISSQTAQVRNIASLEEGCRVQAYRILRPVRILADSEVYQVQGESGRLLALKISSTGPPTTCVEQFMHEAEILAYLNGLHSPLLHAQGWHENRYFLAMEWCDGERIAPMANALREPGNEFQLLELCGAVLDAYADLHAKGVIHGDVHAANILVDHAGTIQILDFALSRCLNVHGFSEPPRGGLGFLLEPEYAAAVLHGEAAPRANPEGEQYALAALVYLLLTGKPYLAFALERERVYQQIIAENPLSFFEQGLAPSPAIESVLQRALSKDPTRRFASMAEFAQNFRAAALPRTANGPHPSNNARFLGDGSVIAQTYLDSVLKRLDKSADNFRGEFVPPYSSVAFGAAGIAYLLYRVACVRNDSRALAHADRWITLADKKIGQADAFTAPELQLSQDVTASTSLYYGEAGVHVVRVLVSYAQGDFPLVRAALARFLRAASYPTGRLDLTSGQASALLGCALLHEALNGCPFIDLAALVELGDALCNSLWAEIDSTGSLRDEHNLGSSLGIAHGWAGILYATGRWNTARASTPAPAMLTRLDELISCAVSSNDNFYWHETIAAGEKPWVGWCRGTAGYVHLWLRADHTYQQPRFLEYAVGAARHTLQHPHSKLAHLCCGLAGQAEALFALFKTVNDPEWLNRARAMGVQALKMSPSLDFRANSLLKGNIGLALLALDILEPGLAAMPLFGGEE